MKKLTDICLSSLADNLHGNLSCVLHRLATAHKEQLLERLVCHDRLTPDYLPHITYNLFSSTLKHIHFYKCHQVTDTVLEQLSYSQCKLLSLKINECSFVTDVGIVFITKDQTCLEHFELRKMHQLTAKAFVSVFSPSLRTIIIRSCSKIRTEAIQNLLKKIDSVEELALMSCKMLDDSVIPVIAHRIGQSLKILNLRDLYKLSNSSLTLLASSCPELVSLNLNGCSHITGEGLIQIVQKCTNLRNLDLAYCTGLQNGPSSDVLMSLPLNLQELSLVGVMSSDTDLMTNALKRLSGLKSLRLCGIPAITDASLDEILGSVGPLLENLDLSGGLMSPLTDEGLAAIARHCHHLNIIGLSMLRRVTGVSLLPILRDEQRAPKLKFLWLTGLKLDPDVLCAISSRCSGLEKLHLSGVSSVTDEFLVAAAKLCSSLKELSIKACVQVTDVGMCAVAQYCPLECISLSGVTNVTDRSVYALANGCPYLREICVSGCHVSLSAISYLVNTCIPRVFVLHEMIRPGREQAISNSNQIVGQPLPTAAGQKAALH